MGLLRSKVSTGAERWVCWNLGPKFVMSRDVTLLSSRHKMFKLIIEEAFVLSNLLLTQTEFCCFSNTVC